MIHNKEYLFFLNKIPTNLRDKYIAASKNKDFNQQEILIELELLAKETSGNILPKIIYPDLPVTDKVDDIKKLL
jgi:ATP-dependent helicase HrpA